MNIEQLQMMIIRRNMNVNSINDYLFFVFITYSRTVHLSIFSLICWGNRLFLCLLLLLLMKQAYKILQNRLKSSIMMYTNKIFSL